MSRTLQQAFIDSELQSPEVPACWASTLKEQRPWLFCTDSPPRQSLLDIDFFLQEAISKKIENGLVISVQSDETNSQVLHYYLVEEDVVLLLQMPVGKKSRFRESQQSFSARAVMLLRRLFGLKKRQTADNPDNAIEYVHHNFALLAQMLRELERINRASIALPSRLVVLLSSRSRSRWSWVPKAMKGESDTSQTGFDETLKPMNDWTWYFDDDVLAEALEALRKL